MRGVYKLATGLLALTFTITTATAQAKKGSTTHKKKTGTTSKIAHHCAPSSKTQTEQDQPGCGTHCGTERWRVKTLADADADQVNTQSEPSTVAQLVSESIPC